jgi:hypothetical protein
MKKGTKKTLTGIPTFMRSNGVSTPAFSPSLPRNLLPIKEKNALNLDR